MRYGYKIPEQLDLRSEQNYLGIFLFDIVYLRQSQNRQSVEIHSKPDANGQWQIL